MLKNFVFVFDVVVLMTIPLLRDGVVSDGVDMKNTEYRSTSPSKLGTPQEENTLLYRTE
jgi:hypothetical protein